MNAEAVAERFFTAFYSGDTQGTRDAVTQDFALLGPFASVHNAAELLQLSAGLMRVVRGHKILRCVVAENEVAALLRDLHSRTERSEPLGHRRLLHCRRRPPVQRPGDLRLRGVRRHRLPGLTGATGDGSL
jgi:hypothetical protein